MLSMPRAGQTTTGWLPRNSSRRHSFSIGVWKPPIDGHAGVAHGPGKVVGLEDEVAWAAIGAEEGGQRLVEQALGCPGGACLPAARIWHG